MRSRSSTALFRAILVPAQGLARSLSRQDLFSRYAGFKYFGVKTVALGGWAQLSPVRSCGVAEGCRQRQRRRTRAAVAHGATAIRSPSRWAPAGRPLTATYSFQRRAPTRGPDGACARRRPLRPSGRQAAGRRPEAHRLRYANAPGRSLSRAELHIHFSWSSNLTATALYIVQSEMDCVFPGLGAPMIIQNA